MKLYEYLKKLSETTEENREEFMGYLEMRNLCSVELTENDMWILTNASTNKEYLDSKLAEEETTLAPAVEAPDEVSGPTDEEKINAMATEMPTPTETAETPTETAETPTEMPTPTETAETPTETAETPTETAETPTETAETPTDDEDDDSEIETSKEGIGVLALLGEIQEKLATGKPSAVEVAAIKALKKLVS